MYSKDVLLSLRRFQLLNVFFSLLSQKVVVELRRFMASFPPFSLKAFHF